MSNEGHFLPGVDPGRVQTMPIPTASIPTSHSGLDVMPKELDVIGENLKLNNALPNLKRHEPTAILLDINNLFRRAKLDRWKIDYRDLKRIFERRCDLRYCAAFSAIDRSTDDGDRWVKYMKKQGYTLFTKNLFRYTNKFNEEVAKGNMDIELTLEAMDLSPGFRHIIIGTCDGDFTPLVERLKRDRSRTVSVLGMSGSDRMGMSEDLVRAADNFYDMTAIQSHLEYTGKRHDQ